MNENRKRRCRISEAGKYTDFSPHTFYSWRQKGWYPELFLQVNNRCALIDLEKYEQMLASGGFARPKEQRGAQK